MRFELLSNQKMRGKGWRTRRNSPGSFKSRCVTLTLTLGGLWGGNSFPAALYSEFPGPQAARTRRGPPPTGSGRGSGCFPAGLGGEGRGPRRPGPAPGPEPTCASPPAPAAAPRGLACRSPETPAPPRPASRVPGPGSRVPGPRSRVPGPGSRVPRPGVQVRGPRSDCAAGNWPLDFLRPDPGWGRPWAGRGGPGFRLPASGLAVSWESGSEPKVLGTMRGRLVGCRAGSALAPSGGGRGPGDARCGGACPGFPATAVLRVPQGPHSAGPRGPGNGAPGDWRPGG